MSVALRTCCFCGHIASAALFIQLGNNRWRCKSGGARKRRISAQHVRLRP